MHPTSILNPKTKNITNFGLQVAQPPPLKRKITYIKSFVKQKIQKRKKNFTYYVKLIKISQQISLEGAKNHILKIFLKKIKETLSKFGKG